MPPQLATPALLAPAAVSLGSAPLRRLFLSPSHTQRDDGESVTRVRCETLVRCALRCRSETTANKPLSPAAIQVLTARTGLGARVRTPASAATCRFVRHLSDTGIGPNSAKHLCLLARRPSPMSGGSGRRGVAREDVLTSSRRGALLPLPVGMQSACGEANARETTTAITTSIWRCGEVTATLWERDGTPPARTLALEMRRASHADWLAWFRQDFAPARGCSASAPTARDRLVASRHAARDP